MEHIPLLLLLFFVLYPLVTSFKRLFNENTAQLTLDVIFITLIVFVLIIGWIALDGNQLTPIFKLGDMAGISGILSIHFDGLKAAYLLALVMVQIATVASNAALPKAAYFFFSISSMMFLFFEYFSLLIFQTMGFLVLLKCFSSEIFSMPTLKRKSLFAFYLMIFLATLLGLGWSTMQAWMGTGHVEAVAKVYAFSHPTFLGIIGFVLLLKPLLVWFFFSGSPHSLPLFSFLWIEFLYIGSLFQIFQHRVFFGLSLLSFFFFFLFFITQTKKKTRKACLVCILTSLGITLLHFFSSAAGQLIALFGFFILPLFLIQSFMSMLKWEKFLSEWEIKNLKGLPYKKTLEKASIESMLQVAEKIFVFSYSFIRKFLWNSAIVLLGFLWARSREIVLVPFAVSGWFTFRTTHVVTFRGELLLFILLLSVFLVIYGR